MHLICYKPYSPTADSLAMIGQVTAICTRYAADGFSLTLRQVYYQLVKTNAIPNSKKSYNRLKALLTRAREGGLLDWDYITDRTRAVQQKPFWDDVTHFLECVVPQFAIDLWEDQPKRVEVWVEKEALVEVVGRAANKWGVPYLANKGYLSASAMWEAGHNRFCDAWEHFGQTTVVIHLGDHDPSGIHMTQDIKERVNLFAQPGNMPSMPEIEIDRIALNRNQVDEYDPPPNPAKETDARYANYCDVYGGECWELDALDPNVIVKLIDAAIRRHLDLPKFRKRKKLQRKMKRELDLKI